MSRRRMSPLQRQLYRKPRKAPKPRAAEQLQLVVLRPYACVVLAIDPGETSGWAVIAEGKLVQWGEVNVFDHAAMANVVRSALQVAEIAGLPFAMMIEEGNFRGATGASRPLWRKAASNAGVNARRVRRVLPKVWRSRFFGKGAGGWSTETARTWERARALNAIVDARIELPTALGHDAAAAICIGLFAACSPIVGKVLPVSVRRAAEAV